MRALAAVVAALLCACENETVVSATAAEGIVTDVRRDCRDDAELADKRAAFITDCIRAWNPGEEEWGARLGRKCAAMAEGNWPPPSTCNSWHVRVRKNEHHPWGSCDLQTDPKVIATCRAAGWVKEGE